ncbi:MAG: discoidin domain-containing protein [Lachnospiraceae bacterium]|nr:discoidin domain-containing protein [Lachnospiraceae bacterium]
MTDTNNNRYFGIQTNPAGELSWEVGGAMADSVLTNAVSLGKDFTGKEVWYHLHIVIDMEEEKTSFTITNKENSAITATGEAEFDSALSYAGDVAAIQFVGTRASGLNLSWNPALDNINIYKTALEAKEINVNKETVKLIPIKDTLGTKYQLTAQVLPEGVSQEVIWESLDTSLVTVDENGLITPVVTYDSLSEIVTGSCTVKVSSASNPSVYKEITVNISNSPNASEFFFIKDEEGNYVYEMGEGASTVELETGEQKQYIPVLTGGDGDTDLADVKWESEDTSVVTIDAKTGELKAVGPGNAKVTLTVTLYTGNPLTGEIYFTVTGEALADTFALETAIATAKAAKTEADDYYTAESLTAYKKALEQAESDLASAIAEKWSSEKQSVLDKDVEDLNAAVEGLKQDDVLRAITIQELSGKVLVNKKVQLNAEIVPAAAKEKIYWTSSDTSVAVVSKTDGMLIPVGEGTVVITAKGANGKVSATKEITVTAKDTADLTSWYDTEGVTITGTNEARPATNAFINARTMNINAGNTAWTTGSATKVGEIRVDLGAKARIDNVVTSFWSQLKYTIDISEDGENWTTVMDHSKEAAGGISDNSETCTDTFPENIVTRHIRLNVLENGGTGWVGVTLMQVNGEYVLSEKIVSEVSCAPVIVAGADKLASDLPETVAITLKDGSSENVSVTWDEEALEKVTEADGNYTITGTVVVDGIAYNVNCSLTVDSSFVDKEGDADTDKDSDADKDADTDKNPDAGKLPDTDSGSVEKTDIQSAAVVLEQDVYEYDGTEKKPSVALTVNGAVVPADGYTVAYTDNIHAGTAAVTINGTGNYTGSVTKNFTISKSDDNICLENVSIEKAYNSKNFSLGAKTADGSKLTYKLNNKKVIKLVKDKVKALAIGKVTVTLTSAESADYLADTEKITVTITPKKVKITSVKSKKSGQAAVKWKKDAKANGYEITYAANKNFKKAKTVNVKSGKTVTKNLTKLSKGKNCYIKVRAYKTVKGKKIYGEYSAVKKVKVKK